MNFGAGVKLPDTRCVTRASIYSHALSARYYGLPVYLVGSALRDPDPRDIDIVIPVPDDLFLSMYGDAEDTLVDWADAIRAPRVDLPKQWLRWARDCAKQGRELTYFCHRQVDFKTQPQTYFDTFNHKPRQRLDCDILRSLT